MKRYNLYIVAFLTSLFLFNACQDEDLVKKTEVVEGIPVTLKLKLGATDKEEITTRAALEKEQENKVYDVFVYVFRKAGSSWEKEHGELFSYSTGNNGPETIRIENNVTSGARRIYAVANAVKSGYATEEALKAVSSLEELEAMTFRMGEPSVNRIGGALLMSGHLVCANQDIAGYYEIPAPKDGNKEVNIDGQIEIYASLLNYLTYSPEIQEVIQNKDMDRYTAYEQYTEVVDPLLTVPKSYHEAILGIQLFAESIPVRHEYTLAPLSEVEGEWWSDKLDDSVTVQWIVDRDNRQIAAVREIYDGKTREAVLCITLDYGKVFRPLANIIERNSGGLVVDNRQNIVYHGENLAASDISAQKETGKMLDRLREEYTYVSSSGHETRWTYYFYKPPAVIESSVSKVLISEIPLIGFCVVIIIVLGMTFSTLFTRKIEQLTRNMEQVNQGSREVTVYSDSRDEVGQLVRSFRHMMDEINRLIEEVYENKIALKEFELKALTAQINPHFLYNSLSIINWMAIKSRQKEISRVTLALSTFYRTALSKGADMVTVENCIRNIEAYLEIQLIMHDNDFKVEWNIDPSVQQELVPKLALQPIVENALEHGLDVKEEGEKLLKLYFFEENGDVVIRVEDNGIGMEQEQAEKLLTYQAKGYGLKNVNDRMCILYGEDYAIRILSKVGQGTRVDMRIPKEVKKDET